MAEETFAEWCIVELLGHRRLAGYVREVQLAGAGFLRLDIPERRAQPVGPEHYEKTLRPARTQFIAPGSVYSLHPVAEEVARACADHWHADPVHRWELPAATKPADEWTDDDQAATDERLAEEASEAMTLAVDQDPDYGRDEDDDEEPF